MSRLPFILLLLLFGCSSKGPDIAGSGSKTGNAITGKLFTRAGDPAAGVRVTAYSIGKNDSTFALFWSLAQTGSCGIDGAYKFENLSVGTYSIEASLQTDKIFMPGIIMPNADTTVLLPDSRLKGTGNLQGVISIPKPDSSLVRFICYAVGLPSADTSDTAGRFTLPDMPEGSFELFFIPVSIADTADVPAGVLRGGLFDGTVVVKAGETSTVAITPPPPDTLPPILSIATAGQTVNTDSILVNGTASDTSGIDSVMVGGRRAAGTTNWSLKVGLVVGPNNIIVQAWDTRGNHSRDSVLITYQVLPDSGKGSIMGIVVNSSYAGVTGVRVSAYGTGLSVMTNGTGNYRIDSIPAGDQAVGFIMAGATLFEKVVTLARDTLVIINDTVPDTWSPYLSIPPRDSSNVEAWFSFNETAGTSLMDSSLHSNMGTLGTAARIRSPQGHALSFTPGTYSDVTLAPACTGYVIIDFWLYVQDTTNIRGTTKITVVTIGNTEIYFQNDLLNSESQDAMGDAAALMQFPASLIPGRKWMKVKMFFAQMGGEMIVDYNYAYIGPYSRLSGHPFTPKPISTIRLGSNTGNGFAGNIDELKIWK